MEKRGFYVDLPHHQCNKKRTQIYCSSGILKGYIKAQVEMKIVGLGHGDRKM